MLCKDEQRCPRHKTKHLLKVRTLDIMFPVIEAPMRLIKLRAIHPFILSGSPQTLGQHQPTYMPRMLNRNVEIMIAGSSGLCRIQYDKK